MPNRPTGNPVLIVLLVVIGLAACTAAQSPTPVPRPTPPPATPSPSPSPVPTPGHCAGSDQTPGRSAGPAISEESENWAGYVVYLKRTTVSCVEGSWVQPTISCPATGMQDVAIWVGIDGVKSPKTGVDSSATLEQIGTQAGCDGGQEMSSAWYQVIPQDPLSVPITTVTIAPGDEIWAMVSFADGTLTLQLLDVTSGGSFSVDRSLADAPRLTAEWIVEAPKIGCPNDCVIAALPDFRQIDFGGADLSTGSQRGSITDDHWTHSATEMIRGTTVRAKESGLSSGGTEFTVTWRHI